MKNGIIVFKQSFDNYNLTEIEKTASELSLAGFKVDYLEFVKTDDKAFFLNSFVGMRNTCANVFIIGGERAEFDAKAEICYELQVELRRYADVELKNVIQNDDYDTSAEDFIKKDSKGFYDKPESESERKSAKAKKHESEFRILPKGSVAIQNEKGENGGFVIDETDFCVLYLSSASDDLQFMMKKFVIPFLTSKYGIDLKRTTLKYCGDSEGIKKTLEEAKEIAEKGFSYNLIENYGDFKIELAFQNHTEQQARGVIRYILSKHYEDIYAEQDEPIEERLFDILKLKKLRLSTAESFTGGSVIFNVIKNSGASNVVSEGIVCYSNESKIERLGVRLQDIQRLGAVSSEVAYQMAVGLLKGGQCDVAIASTGIAGPKSDDSEKPVGLCYIAIGTKRCVHTYKFNLKGDRKRITETAKNYALFLAIKNLKKYNEEI